MPLPPDKLAAFAGHDPAPDGGEDATAGEYGGKGPFALPPDHQAGMTVPKGGSSCSNCRFLDDAGLCTEPNFVAWNGGTGRLPAPPDQYCSDWFRAGESPELPDEE